MATTRNIRELFVKYPELRNDERVAAIDEIMKKNPAAFDPRAYLTPIMDTVMYGVVPSNEVQRVVDAIKDAIMEVTGKMIVEFGSYHTANFVKSRSLEELALEYQA